MTNQTSLLVLNPELDRKSLRREFARNGRIQIRDVLTVEAATKIAGHLAEHTPWGLSWSTPELGVHKLSAEHVARLGPANVSALMERLGAAMAGRGFSFLYGQYLMHDYHVLGQQQHPLFDQLAKEFNAAPFLDFIRGVTDCREIEWADSQATAYGPGHFLSLHQDIVPGQERLIAYVLNLCTVDWRPDWGGYLNFFDRDGNIVTGYRPIFNSLNMFRVPQDHHVSFVPGFAPVGRFAITGWFRGPDQPESAAV